MIEGAKLIWVNAQAVRGELKKADVQRVKAGQTAVRVEGFQLMKKLKSEVRAGSVAGKSFSPLTEIAKRSVTGGARAKKPSPNRKAMSRTAVAIRYAVTKLGGGMQMSVGYVESGGRSGKMSKSWTKIANKLQEGGTHPVTEKLRARLMEIGASMQRGRNKRAARCFFLRKSTQQFSTPARPVIAPFWRMHGPGALRRIESNYERKMKGERI